jgi:hypothetical protein
MTKGEVIKGITSVEEMVVEGRSRGEASQSREKHGARQF